MYTVFTLSVRMSVRLSGLMNGCYLTVSVNLCDYSHMPFNWAIYSVFECYVAQVSFYWTVHIKENHITTISCAYKKSHNNHFVRLSIHYVLVSVRGVGWVG